MARVQRRPEDYTVGWICALQVELRAARAMLDEEHEGPVTMDGNVYTFGRIERHNVVVGCLPPGQYGTNRATAVATRMMITFPSMRIRFMVGIGGGVPGAEADVRLGDVVVSKPADSLPGVVQYDMGKRLPNGYQRTGCLAPPPELLLQATSKLETGQSRRLLSSLLPHGLQRPTSQDILFKKAYNHIGGSTCKQCRRDRVFPRSKRTDNEPVVHYGTIASGNMVMKDGVERDRLRDQIGGLLCFEMEAAGLMNDFPCLVIRGICDYADTHKNKEWQPYAAGVAAAYTKELLSVIPSVVGEIPRLVDNTFKAEKESWQPTKVEQDRCLQAVWFREVSMRESNIGDKTPGTCEWLLNHESYRSWTNQRQGILWVKGKPGAGKSTLMKFALEAERNHEESHSMIILGFFFYGRAGNNSIQNSLLGLYRSLLHQILTQVPEMLLQFMKRFKHVLAQFMDKHKNNLKSTSEQKFDWTMHESELRNFLKDWIPYYSKSCPIRIFVDALDESGEKIAREIVQYFQRMMKDAQSMDGSLKICFSCRHYPIFSSQNWLEVCVDDENEQDLAMHIREQLEDRPDALQLQNKILIKAQGLFQWVVLVVQMIAEMYDVGEWGNMDSLLEDIPEGLVPFYDNILVELATKERQRSVRLMRWICYAIRPLSVKETQWAMMLDGDCPFESLNQLRKDRQFAATDEQVRKQIKSLSGGLVEVVEQENGRYVVQFIHQSVKDYMIEIGLGRLDCEVGKSQNHLQLSRACINYLKMLEIRGCRPRNDALIFDYAGTEKIINTSQRECARDELLELFPLLLYASRGWAEHANNTPPSGRYRWVSDLLPWPSSQFSDTLLLLAQTLYFYSTEHDLYRTTLFPWHTTILHQATLFVVDGVVEAICDCVPGAADCKDDCGRTALSWAALLLPAEEVEMKERGITERQYTKRVAKLTNELVERQTVDLNSKDELGLTPLAIACRYQNDDNFELLIKQRGVDVNSRDLTGITPLTWIAQHGDDLHMARVLLRHNADTDSRDLDGLTPLAWAAICGEERTGMVRLLHQRTADANPRDLDGLTPLAWAASYGLYKVAGTLLEREGVDADSRDAEGCTPLARAARTSVNKEGSTSVAKLLLQQREVLTDSRDVHGRTPLAWAARNAHSAVAGLLLTYGADAMSRDSNGLTPLAWAAKEGDVPTVRLLLGRSDVNAKDKKGRSPLSWAATRSAIYSFSEPKTIEGVVQALLGWLGVEADSKDMNGRTPLSWAAGRGTLRSKKTVEECEDCADDPATRLLLARVDVDPNSRDIHNRTPLSWAAEAGSRQALKLLTDLADVDIHACDDEGRTPQWYLMKFVKESGRMDKLTYGDESFYRELQLRLS
ncbi:MAG: hypothetical protein Q9165_001496 [Trypethelium subeluteriae]